MTEGRDVSRLPRWNIFGSRLIFDYGVKGYG